MSQVSVDTENHKLAELQEQLHKYVQESLKALELRLSLEQQRQRDHLDTELHKLRQHLTDVGRDQQQQQQTTFATFSEALEELRKEVSEALQHLSRDLDRATQVAESHLERASERLRLEVLESLLERDKMTVKNHLLGELFITLGKQLQGAQGIPRNTNGH